MRVLRFLALHGRLVFLTLAAQVEDSLHVAVAVPSLQLENLFLE